MKQRRNWSERRPEPTTDGNRTVTEQLYATNPPDHNNQTVSVAMLQRLTLILKTKITLNYGYTLTTAYMVFHLLSI